MKPAPFLKSAKGKSNAAQPVGAAEFAVLMQRFALPLDRRFAVAVSGGPDSMALAYCAQRWAAEEGKEIVAFIVDHGLRLESPVEARQTRADLTAIGIKAEILRWSHPPVVSRLHEIARKARYRLLIDACKQHDVSNLLFAHHSQDQAETILMRMAKGSGIDGLAGMAPQSAIEGIRILRPFLKIDKERLNATCTAANLPFVSDPSNNAIKFARGRLRRILPMLAEEGFTVERMSNLGARAAEAKAALDHAATVLLRVGGKMDEGGAIHFNLEQLRSAPLTIAQRALAKCLQTICPQDYPPEHASLTRLADMVIGDAPMPACTLHGCYIGKSETDMIVMREYAGISGEPAIKPGTTIIWDRRWRLYLSADAKETYIIRPLGNPTYELLHGLAPGLRRQIRQGRIRATLPGLWLNDSLALIPALPRSKYQALASAEPVRIWPPA